jgi:hypothetical protein
MSATTASSSVGPIFRDVAQHRHAEYEAVLLFLGPGEAALVDFCEPFSVQ